MKKLIVMAAVVCAAVAAQAVNLTWKWSGTFTDVEGNNLTMGDYKAYLYRGTGNNMPDATSFSSGDGLKIPKGFTFVASSEWHDNMFGNKSQSASSFDGDNHSWAIVLVSDKITQANLEAGIECYATVITGNGTYRTSPTASMSITNMSGGQLSAYGSPEPTPEPTSGLLVLIGMGALALKRRRA